MTFLCLRGNNKQNKYWKNQMPRVGIEPTTHQFHDWCSTTELPWQLQWDGLILNTDSKYLYLDLLDWELLLLIVKQLAHQTRCKSLINVIYIQHISNKWFIVREKNSDVSKRKCVVCI